MPPDQSVFLVGYSGGGLIASYLADRVANVEGMITLGANLDLAAWAAHHAYTPLIVSRSPPSPFPIRAGVVQLHVFGEKDEVSPAWLASAVLQRDPRARQLILEGADHACCWVHEWTRIRARFSIGS